MCEVLRNARAKEHRLSAAESSALEAVVANRHSPQKHVWRAKIVLLRAEGRGTAKIMQPTGKASVGRSGSRTRVLRSFWRDKTRPSPIPPQRPAVSVSKRRFLCTTLLNAISQTKW